MNRSQADRGLLPDAAALQHEHGAPRAPRPLPLFLALVQDVAAHDPVLARQALAGVRAYERAERGSLPRPQPEIARVRGATIRDHGGEGPPAILIPSLINPPHILDLDPQVSLAGALARMGRRALLLDWGPAQERGELSIAGHIEALLVPLLREFGEPAALIGYCLGGTMAMAAANLARCERVANLAAPWRFSAYPEDGRTALLNMWRDAKPSAQVLGALPMEVLQAAFWSLDPQRTVRKFADFAELDPSSAEAHRFVALEDWANGGEPLPYAAAAELIGGLFARDLPGAGEWKVGRQAMTDQLGCPALHLTAAHDRIAPEATAPGGNQTAIQAGHVGMVVGSARKKLHAELSAFVDPACR